MKKLSLLFALLVFMPTLYAHQYTNDVGTGRTLPSTEVSLASSTANVSINNFFKDSPSFLDRLPPPLLFGNPAPARASAPTVQIKLKESLINTQLKLTHKQ